MIADGFLNKVFSGKYPNIESLFSVEFIKLCEEAFSRLPDDDDGELDDFESLFEESHDDGDQRELVDLRGEVERLQEVIEHERERHESTKRQLALARSECRELQYRLARVGDALKVGLHAEPL